MYRKNLNIKYKSEMLNQKFERKVKSNTIVHIKVEKYIWSNFNVHIKVKSKGTFRVLL